MWSAVGNYATRFLATIGARWLKPVEPRTEVIAEEVVLPAFHEAQFMPLIAANDSVSVANGPAFSPAKRQYCDPGWGYCSSFGRCCPANNRCCRSGYCLPPGGVCCDNGICPSGQTCCGKNNCRPIGSKCCNNGEYCAAGNICVLLIDDDRMVCCTDLQCTAHVEDGRTTYASTTTRFTTRPVPTTTTRRTTTRRTVTRTQTRTYYYTITWTYYYYYWTYYISIRASVVTSSARTTRTTVRVLATNSADARDSFEAMTPTVTFSTPAAATSLASLEGITSFDPGFGSSTESPSTTTAETLTTTTGQPPFVPSGAGVSGGITAKRSADWLPICLASVGLGIGIMAIWL